MLKAFYGTNVFLLNIYLDMAINIGQYKGFCPDSIISAASQDTLLLAQESKVS